MRTLKSGLFCIVLCLSLSWIAPAALAGDHNEGGEILQASPVTGSGGNYQVTADEADSDFLHNAGDWVTRFGIDFTAAAGISTSQGISAPDNIIVGLSGGAGYYPIELLSTDLDIAGDMIFGGDAGFDVSNLSVTPGSRIYPLPEIYLRAGVPFTHLTGDPIVNLLGGLGYEVPVGDSQTLNGEAAITYPLSAEGSGVITIGGGTSFSF